MPRTAFGSNVGYAHGGGVFVTPGSGSSGFTPGSVIIADSAGRLTDDAGLTYVAATDALSAGSFIPTGSTVPANGMYLPAANTVGIAANSVDYVRVRGADGFVTLGANVDTAVNGILQANIDDNSAVTGSSIFGATATGVWVWNKTTSTATGSFLVFMGGAGANSGAAIAGVRESDGIQGLRFFTGTAANTITEAARFVGDGSLVLGSSINATALATGGLTIYGAASQKGLVVRSNATTPGFGIEVQASGGGSLFSVNGTTGAVLAGAGSASAPGYAFSAETNTGISAPGSGVLVFSGSGTEYHRMSTSSWVFGSDVATTPLGRATVYGAASGKGLVVRAHATTPGNAIEAQDSAGNLLATVGDTAAAGQPLTVRPGTADHGVIGFFARTATPTTRSGYFGYPAAGSSNFTWINSISGGTVTIEQSGAGVIDLRTNGSLRWRVEATGDIRAGADNTYDIGASGATRPRTGYFGTSVITPAINNGNTGIIIGADASDAVGFYGTAATAQQTGVAVSAAGIHAALVTLGLITA